VDPTNLGGIWRHGETRIEQTLIEAIAGPEQHLVPTRHYQIFVSVRRRVVDGEDSHSNEALIRLSLL
jgi:hypothetical protein